MIESNTLFASLIWGSVGVGYFIYGKKQTALAPLIGGVLMIVASYLAPSAWTMTLMCIGIMALTHLLLRWGY